MRHRHNSRCAQKVQVRCPQLLVSPPHNYCCIAMLKSSCLAMRECTHIFGLWNVLFTVCVVSNHKCRCVVCVCCVGVCVCACVDVCVCLCVCVCACVCLCGCVCAMDVCCIYRNLPKIGPLLKTSLSSFLNEVVAKSAFLSKVHHLFMLQYIQLY